MQTTPAGLEPAMTHGCGRRRHLVAALGVAALLLCGCGQRSTPSPASPDLPPVGPGDPGQGGLVLPASFFQQIDGADSVDGAVAALDRQCESDPTITDVDGCEAAVRTFIGSTPITVTGQDVDGCRTTWDGSRIVLTGRSCVSRFHLVDTQGRPVDPAALPPDGRLPTGAGVAAGAVPPAPGSTGKSSTGGTPSGGGTTSGGGDGKGGGGPDPSKTTPPAVLADGFFERIGGTDIDSLEKATQVLDKQCDDPKLNLGREDSCRAAVKKFFETTPVVLDTTSEETGGCGASWEKDSDARTSTIKLAGKDCIKRFKLVGPDGKRLNPKDVKDGQLPAGSGIRKPRPVQTGTTGGGSTGNTTGTTTDDTTGGQAVPSTSVHPARTASRRSPPNV